MQGEKLDRLLKEEALRITPENTEPQERWGVNLEGQCLKIDSGRIFFFKGILSRLISLIFQSHISRARLMYWLAAILGRYRPITDLSIYCAENRCLEIV